MPKTDPGKLAPNKAHDQRNALISAEWGVYRSDIEKALRGSYEEDLIYMDASGQRSLFGESDRIYVKGEKVEQIRNRLQTVLGNDYIVEEKDEGKSGGRILSVKRKHTPSVTPVISRPAENDAEPSAWEGTVGPATFRGWKPRR